MCNDPSSFILKQNYICILPKFKFYVDYFEASNLYLESLVIVCPSLLQEMCGSGLPLASHGILISWPSEIVRLVGPVSIVGGICKNDLFQ